MKRRILRKGLHWSAGACLGLCLVWAGCQQAGSDPATLVDPLDTAQGADLQRITEVQLVEQMALHRRQYGKYLELLRDFYDRQGNQLKTSWVRDELDHFQHGPRYEYLVIAEVAGPELRARDSIAEADMLYQEGLELMRQGRGSLGKLFVDEKKLYQAIDRFNQVISQYPTSDKIDDAAFQIGQIDQHWLKDYNRALLYYQRVWQWDPQTPLPARFAVARIYDEQFHDLPKALGYYRQAINLESDYPENVVHAQNRIEAINKTLTPEP